MEKQRGMAILMVLMMMTLMAIIAVNINGYWQRSLTRTQLQQDQVRAKWLLLGGEIFAKKWLQQTLEKQTTVNFGQAWTRKDLSMLTEGGKVTVNINDADVCFNLNSLANDITQDNFYATNEKLKHEKKIFILLLNNLGVTEQQANEIADSIIMKISTTDKDKTSYFIEDVSELREISEISRELYGHISPLVCALPDRSLQININTVSSRHVPLLRAMLFNKIDFEQSLDLISTRPAKGWSSSDILFTEYFPELKKLNLRGENKRLVTISRYFSAELKVKLNEVSYRLTSRLKKSGEHIVVERHQFSSRER